MGHFYGTLEGNRGQASRLGTANSGLRTEAAGWKGCIHVQIEHDEKTGKDHYMVVLKPWRRTSHDARARVLAEGILDPAEPQRTPLDAESFIIWSGDDRAEIERTGVNWQHAIRVIVTALWAGNWAAAKEELTELARLLP